MKTVKSLKSQARRLLVGKYGISSGIIGVYLVFKSMGSMMVTQFFSSTLIMFVLTQLLVLGMNILLEFFQVGLNKCFLDTAYGMHPSMGDLFIGFKKYCNRRFFGAVCMMSLIPTLCMLPANLMTYLVSSFTKTQYAIFFALLLLGLLVQIYFSIIYSQAFYVGFDMAQKSGMELLTMSKWLMKGAFGKYLGLILSFLPMHFLCIISFGVGYIWVLPYIETTKGTFYLELTKHKASGEV